MRFVFFLPAKAAPFAVRRAHGFMQACGQWDDVEATFARIIDPTRRGFPRDFDGIAGSFGEDQLKRVTTWKVPVVNLDPTEIRRVGSVVTNLTALGRMVVDFVTARGSREIAFFVEKDLDRTRGRNIEAIRREARKRGIEPIDLPRESRTTVTKGWSLERDYADVRAWIPSLPQHCTIVCSDDEHAHRLVWAARRIGIEIPGRISVIGIANDPLLCESISPTISSLMIDHEQKGWIGAHLLRDMVLGQAQPGTVIDLPPREVVARESTGFRKPDDPALGRVFQAMEDWEGELPELDEIAARSGMSRRTLHRRLVEATGQTPAKILNQIRLEKALTCLRTSQDTLAEIAAATGYSLPSQLSREVKQFTGETAARYRAKWTSSASAIYLSASRLLDKGLRD